MIRKIIGQIILQPSDQSRPCCANTEALFFFFKMNANTVALCICLDSEDYVRVSFQLLLYFLVAIVNFFPVDSAQIYCS